MRCHCIAVGKRVSLDHMEVRLRSIVLLLLPWLIIVPTPHALADSMPEPRASLADILFSGMDQGSPHQIVMALEVVGGSNQENGITGSEVDTPEHQRALPISVLPAWYQTLWFKLVISCLGVALILGLVQSRTVYLRQRQRLLAQEIEERTHALEVSSDNLRIANTELEQANAELARLAHHDPLTGLGNRRRFFELCDYQIAQARRRYRPCSVLMIDLDHFKQINDRFGHGGGDETLRRAARCLVETVREIDIVARFGGEELAVFLPETSIKEAAQVAERFRQALEQLKIRYEHSAIHVTASIGVAAWSVMEPDIQPALNRADAALYKVKNSGRNGVGVDPLFDHRVAP